MRLPTNRWVAAGAAALLVGACSVTDNLLEVNNPDEIVVEQLTDVALLEVQLNGVIDAFQGAYDNPVIMFSNYMTDEVLTGLNWEDDARVNQRLVTYLDGHTNAVYEQLNRGIRMADNLAERIRGWAADDPSRDFTVELATSLVFAGYSTVVLAELMCQGVLSPDPDAPSDQVLSQGELFDTAFPFLDEALTLATAAGEDDLADLARTALARGHLGRGNWAQAASFGAAVSAGFTWWLDYADIDGGENPLEPISFGGNFRGGIHPWFTGVHPSFDGTGFAFEDNDVIAPQTDPRIQHIPTDRTGHNRLTRLYKIGQGRRYSGYQPGETIAPLSAGCPACTGMDPDDLELIATDGTDIMLADDVEAQHHRMEALAMMDVVANEAEILAFVNARRAVGNQAAVALSGQALITELRNQRARDLYMGGFRLGDLRRWTQFDAGNGPFAAGSYFPTGQHPNAQWGDYGPWTCYPIPIEEYEGNPSLTTPADPNTPPAI